MRQVNISLSYSIYNASVKDNELFTSVGWRQRNVLPNYSKLWNELIQTLMTHFVWSLKYEYMTSDSVFMVNYWSLQNPCRGLMVI